MYTTAKTRAKKQQDTKEKTSDHVRLPVALNVAYNFKGVVNNYSYYATSKLSLQHRVMSKVNCVYFVLFLFDFERI